MQTYIDDLKGDYTKEASLIIAICGPSGSGKSTIAKTVANYLGIERLSAGDFFRQIAQEKNLTVEELSEKADKQTDLKVDKRTLEKALKKDAVVESRIAAWVLGDYADLKIYITADLEERAKRVQSNTKNRIAENQGTSNEIKQRIKTRDRNNRQRYKQYYGIDMKDKSIFDLIIDNTKMSIQQQEDQIKKILNKEYLEKNPK